MHRHNQVAVLLRQFQLGQVINRVPKRRADDDPAGGVLFPDDGERLTEVVIPEFWGEAPVRFVEHLKKHVVRAP